MVVQPKRQEKKAQAPSTAVVEEKHPLVEVAAEPGPEPPASDLEPAPVKRRDSGLEASEPSAESVQSERKPQGQIKKAEQVGGANAKSLGSSAPGSKAKASASLTRASSGIKSSSAGSSRASSRRARSPHAAPPTPRRTSSSSALSSLPHRGSSATKRRPSSSLSAASHSASRSKTRPKPKASGPTEK